MTSSKSDPIQAQAIPVLGICLGLQLLCEASEETPGRRGLGLLPVEAQRFPADLVVPHMGWNALTFQQKHPILDRLGADPHVYFTHSYAYRNPSAADIAATTEYGETIIAAVARDNMFATQFHPEKSQRVGLQILSNFVLWDPK